MSIRQDNKPKRTLEQIGVFTIADEKVRQRIEEYKNLDGYIKNLLIIPEKDEQTKKRLAPEAKIAVIIENLQLVNGKLHEISVPWGRAGTETWYAEAMIAWSTLSTIVINIANDTRSQLQRIGRQQETHSEQAKSELVSKLHTFITLIFVKYAQIVYSISWYRDDVANAWAITVQQQQAGSRPLSWEGLPTQKELKEG
jgi:hypothetical protein